LRPNGIRRIATGTDAETPETDQESDQEVRTKRDESG
jgi:hypothetical protein